MYVLDPKLRERCTQCAVDHSKWMKLFAELERKSLGVCRMPACRADIATNERPKVATPPGVIAFEHIGKMNGVQERSLVSYARRAAKLRFFIQS